MKKAMSVGGKGMGKGLKAGSAKGVEGKRAVPAGLLAYQEKKRAVAGGGASPNAKAPLGSGGRFAALKAELASEAGVKDPGALAASIGRKKMAGMALKGRKKG